MSIEAMSWAMRAERTGPLDPTARLVLLHLADRADHEGRAAYPSKQTLARHLGMSERTVQRHLANLRASGHITEGDQRHVSHMPADRRPTVYDLAMHRIDDPARPVDNMAEPVDDTPASVDNRGDVRVSPVEERGDTQRRHGETPVSPKPKPKPPITPPNPPADARAAARTLDPCPICGQHFLRTHSCSGRREAIPVPDDIGAQIRASLAAAQARLRGEDPPPPTPAATPNPLDLDHEGPTP